MSKFCEQKNVNVILLNRKTSYTDIVSIIYMLHIIISMMGYSPLRVNHTVGILLYINLLSR